MQAVPNWIAFYNHSRLRSSLDYLSPIQFEKCWYEAQHKKAALVPLNWSESSRIQHLLKPGRENEMDNAYWLNKWEANDIAFHEKGTNPDLINYICELNLHPGDSVFVPFCGKSRDMLWLAEMDLNVIGVELSTIACNDFFSELNITPNIIQTTKFSIYQHENIKLFCGDLFDLTMTDLLSVKAVYDCKALIALPSDLRKKYIDHIISCTGRKIRILLLTRESHSIVSPPPFPIDKDELDLLFHPNFDVKQLKHLPISIIPERLVKKGYADIIEGVYLIAESA
jgi:thiopurine S-methyltransferase